MIIFLGRRYTVTGRILDPMSYVTPKVWDKTPDQKSTSLLSDIQFHNAAKKKGSTVFCLHVTSVQTQAEG